MTARDPSLTPQALFGSNTWAAQRLGMSKDTFFRKREALERAGFPPRDPLTNLYVKADVDAWIAKRRRLADTVPATTREVNHDAL